MESIGIVGAGLMGTGIAAVFAAADIAVVLHDTDPARLAGVPGELARLAGELAAGGLLSKEAAAALPGRVRTATTSDALVGQPFVMEAVPEYPALKQEVYAALEAVLGEDAIIASNTSGLMPSVLSEKMGHPERFLVAHFWNPPHAIPLVEVVPCPATSPAVLERTLALLRAVEAEPVVIRREIPGFIGNRLQYALLREALAIVRSGAASAAEVDAVMRASLGRRLGMTGPIETADLGGLDTFLSIATHLMPELAKDEGVLDLIRERVATGHTGARSGQGFYAWPPERVAAVRGRRDRELLRRRLEDRQTRGEQGQ
jgi:3-hydroxybutyryl-CoA dehydrogenase